MVLLSIEASHRSREGLYIWGDGTKTLSRWSTSSLLYITVHPEAFWCITSSKRKKRMTTSISSEAQNLLWNFQPSIFYRIREQQLLRIKAAKKLLKISPTARDVLHFIMIHFDGNVDKKFQSSIFYRRWENHVSPKTFTYIQMDIQIIE